MKLKICHYDTDAPTQGPSSPTHRHYEKNEVEKRAITLITRALQAGHCTPMNKL